MCHVHLMGRILLFFLLFVFFVVIAVVCVPNLCLPTPPQSGATSAAVLPTHPVPGADGHAGAGAGTDAGADGGGERDMYARLWDKEWDLQVALADSLLQREESGMLQEDDRIYLDWAEAVVMLHAALTKGTVDHDQLASLEAAMDEAKTQHVLNRSAAKAEARTRYDQRRKFSAVASIVGFAFVFALLAAAIGGVKRAGAPVLT